MKCVSVWTHSAFTTCMIGYFFFSGFFFLMLCISLNSYYLKWRAGGDCELGETAISTITTCVCLCECVYVCLSGVLSIPYASSTISSFSSLFLFFFMNINAITLGSESCSAPQQMHKHEMRKEKKNTAHWQEPKQQAPVSVRAIVPAQVFSSLFFFAVMFQSQEPSHVPLMEHFTEPFQHAPSWNWRSVSIIRLFFIDTVGYNAAYTHTHTLELPDCSYQFV